MLGFIPHSTMIRKKILFTLIILICVHTKVKFVVYTRLQIFLNIIKLTVMFGLFPLIEHYSWMQSSDLELDYIYPPVNPILGESICASQN